MDRVFEYRVPEGMELALGQRVLAPFGRGNGVTEGYVVALSPDCTYDPQRVKEILRKEDPFPAFTAEQMDLAKQVAEVYHCTMSEALRLMIPAQMRGQRVREKRIPVARLVMEGEELETLLAYTQRRAPSQYATLEMLAQVQEIPSGDLYAICPKAKSGFAPPLNRGGHPRLALWQVGNITPDGV